MTPVPAFGLCYCEQKAEKGRGDAKNKAEDTVQGECRVFALDQEFDVFKRESGKRGEPAAKSRREKDSPVLIQPYRALKARPPRPSRTTRSRSLRMFRKGM